MSDTPDLEAGPEVDLTAALAAALAPHRQEHVPSTGASRCAHGDWEGPFTIHASPGSFAEHTAKVALTALGEYARAVAALQTAQAGQEGVVHLRPALPGPGMQTDGGWLPLGPPRWQDQPTDWVKDEVAALPPLPATPSAPPTVPEHRAVRHDHDEPIIGCRCAERYGTLEVTDEVWNSISTILGGLAGPQPAPPAPPNPASPPAGA